MLKKLKDGRSRIFTKSKKAQKLAGRSAKRKASTISTTDIKRGKRKSAVHSLTSQQTNCSDASFLELVTVDAEGRPTVDINRLIYNPEKHRQSFRYDSKQETLAQYIPDFSFIVCNVCSLCVSAYFALIGFTTLSWKASTEMFSIPNCKKLYDGPWDLEARREDDFYYAVCKLFLVDRRNDFSTDKGYNFERMSDFTILRTKFFEVHYFGLALIFTGLVNVINVNVGINACLQCYKHILYLHIAIDGFLLLVEFVVCILVTFASKCDQHDLNAVREILKNFVHWYGTIVGQKGSETRPQTSFKTGELNALQINLGCCGVDGWMDYLAASFPGSQWFQQRSQVDEAEMVIPFSCCQHWWIRNIYCSQGAHLWTHPSASKELAERFQERIVQEGCMYKLESFCLNFRRWMGMKSLYVTLIHFILILIEAISALVLLRNIKVLMREKKRSMKRKELQSDDGDDSQYGLNTSYAPSIIGGNSTSSRDGKKSLWSKIPEPTEDDLMVIMQRSNFNRFMSRMRGGVIGKLMEEGLTLVTEGHENEEEARMKAIKKLREKEKELLEKAKSAKKEDNKDKEDDKAKHKAKQKNKEKRKTITKPVPVSEEPEQVAVGVIDSMASNADIVDSGVDDSDGFAFLVDEAEHTTDVDIDSVLSEPSEPITPSRKWTKKKTKILWKKHKYLEELMLLEQQIDASPSSGENQAGHETKKKKKKPRRRRKKVKPMDMEFIYKREPWFKNF